MEAVLRRIVAHIVFTTDPEEILLFGSVAAGRQDVHSDLDLLVITENQYHRSITRRQIRDFVARLGFRADVLILTNGELEAEMANPQGFLFNALKMSKKMYKK